MEDVPDQNTRMSNSLTSSTPPFLTCSLSLFLLLMSFSFSFSRWYSTLAIPFEIRHLSNPTLEVRYRVYLHLETRAVLRVILSVGLFALKCPPLQDVSPLLSKVLYPFPLPLPLSILSPLSPLSPLDIH